MVAGFHVPLIPSFELAGSAGAVAFWQIEVGIVGNVGATLFTIVIFTETGPAQEPADGVNVYAEVPTVVASIVEGLHIPATPSLEVAGSAGTVAFWQIEVGIVGKVGTRLFTIVMVTETGPAQEPADGVNV